MKKIKFLGLMFAGIMLVAGSAQAALLSVTGGDNTKTITSAFSLGSETGLALGAPLIAFNSSNAAGGLSLTGPGKLTFEFLGSEALFTNTLQFGGSDIFSNTGTAAGSTSSFSLPAGLVDFILTTSGGGSSASAENGGPITSPLSFAFAAITDTSAILLFDDGGFGDTDLDDFAVKISVSEVPLPAAVWLMLSALLGLVSFSRIRRTGATTA